MVRKALYAGSFYNANSQNLIKQFNLWFEQANIPTIDKMPIGVICPHAGYIYSGSCAAYSYKLLSKFKFNKAIIIHPSHRGNHFQLSIPPYKEYLTPFGNLKRNEELATILNNYSDDIDLWYHQNEHSMEVQLPFLAYVNPKVEILPIMIGNQNRDVSIQLAKLLSETDTLLSSDTAIIVSSDLSHYHSAQEAQDMDDVLAKYILQKNIEAFIQDIHNQKIEACGFSGILTLMYLSERIAKSEFMKLQYTHSGIISGDCEQVVGYLSAALINEEY